MIIKIKQIIEKRLKQLFIKNEMSVLWMEVKAKHLLYIVH